MKSFQVADFNAPLQEVDQPTPQPSGTQVLIRVKAAGVCHSDLHIWEGGYDLGHGRKPLSLKDRGVSLPRTMGHETVGEVLIPAAVAISGIHKLMEHRESGGAFLIELLTKGGGGFALCQLVKVMIGI